MFVLGFGGFFVLLDINALVHTSIWLMPFLVAGQVAFQRGFIDDVDDD
jgi:hypothetical protein